MAFLNDENFAFTMRRSPNGQIDPPQIYLKVVGQIYMANLQGI